jgi:xylulokinase
MFVGVDLGTQSLKAVVVDEQFRVLGKAATGYRPDFPKPGWAEQDPAAWEAALAPSIAGALAAAGVRPADIRGLGIAGQLDGCIAVDAGCRALHPGLLWMDRRAENETKHVSAELVRSRTGIVLDAGHLAAKALWLKRNRLGKTAARFHQPVSYMVERLTGSFVIDHALASTSMVAALDAPRYDTDLLAAFELDAAELPVIAGAGDRAGRLTQAGVELAGLPAGIPVAIGTGDDFSNMLGAGLVAPGRVGVGLGTGEVVGALHPAPLIDSEDMVETHAYPGGGYFIENPGWLSGGAVAWLVGVLGVKNAAELDALAAAAPAGSAGVVFLPCLSGAMAPRWRPGMRGAFHGLTAAHGREHMARALLEGTAFAMRDVVDRLRQMGVATDSLLLVGGGARSRLWGQIRADVSGREAAVPEQIDTSPVGAAMLASTAAGAFASIADAASAIGGTQTRFRPDAKTGKALAESYASYRRLFDALEPLGS